ncbi:MAG: site-2 protease family protein [Candidatus Latescibacterota bacterium]
MNLWRRSLSEVPPAGAPDPQAVRPPLPLRPLQWQPRPVRPRPADLPPWVHALLFALTLISMAAAGAMQQGVDPLASPRALVHLVEGIPFAAALLCILTVHEFGHYFAARRWGVRATLPYFLPLPYISFLGTLGAVIRIRSSIPHKRALLDIGVAGPLAGFAVAVAACVVGLSHSTVVGPEHFGQPPIRLGSPLLFALFTRVMVPTTSPDELVLLSPIAFAGWVGLFITAFNLFPVGQLDGGHVAYALFGRLHRYIARAFFIALLGLGVYGIFTLFLGWPQGWPQGWPGWLALALLLSLFGRDHPAPYDAQLALDGRRRRLGYLAVAVFILCFSPVPFSY